MQITLPPELEHIVQTYIDSGKYQNAEQVLLAGVKLLQQEEIPANVSFGILSEQSQFFPLTEAEMVGESLKVLENHRHDTIPHRQIEAWVHSLGIDRK